MRLLITTQAVDENDPVLGFFIGWIKELATHFDQVHVVCLKEGTHQLPANVHVYSLGKEHSTSRIGYVIGFYRYMWRLRGMYDRVFIHMNPHYVLLWGMVWKLTGTPIHFWRNHAKMNVMTWITARFATRMYYTSPFACLSRYAHAVRMPVGIDMDRFVIEAHNTKSTKKKILFLGRLSRVKQPEVFIETARILSEEYEFHLYGDDPSPTGAYKKGLESQAGKNVFFHPAITNDQTPHIYRAHDIYVNLTPEGSMDKTVLEAGACGVMIIVANKSFKGIVPDESLLETVSASHLAQKITEIETLPTQVRTNMCETTREHIMKEHSLRELGNRLYGYMIA